MNAANPTLMGGGGVDRAIHKRGGPQILKECIKIRATRWRNGLPTGNAVITSGGNLKARYVIHTVGPIWRGGKNKEAQLLANAYYNSLKLAVSKGLKTIAFPSISTGTFGFPLKRASKIALHTVKEFLQKENKIEKVTFVLFSQKDLEIYQQTASRIITLHRQRASAT